MDGVLPSDAAKAPEEGWVRLNDDATVRLTLPARPEFVRIARLVIAGLAGRNGFSYEDVEDLRIAVDELCYLIVGQIGHDGQVTLTFKVREDTLEVEGEGEASVLELSPFSQRILAAVVDSHDIRPQGTDVAFRFSRRRRTG
jgi:hypothetical protein